MKKTILLIAAFFVAGALWAQDETNTEEPQKGFKKDKVFVGGNFGLAFGDYTLINISPQLGYRFNKFLAAGVGINGQYVNDKTFYNEQIKSTIIGLNIFGRVYPIPQLMLQVQPEVNYRFGSGKYYDSNTNNWIPYTDDTMIVPSLLMGGGAVLSSGGNSAYVVSIMYDVLQRTNSPYGRRPIYNFGINVGL